MIFNNFNKIHNELFINKIEKERLIFKKDFSTISSYEKLIEKKEKHIEIYQHLKEELINLNIQFVLLFLSKTSFLLLLIYLIHHFSTEKDMLFFVDFSLFFLWIWDFKDLFYDIKKNWLSFVIIRKLFAKKNKKNLLDILNKMRLNEQEKNKFILYYNQNEPLEWDYAFFQYKLLTG